MVTKKCLSQANGRIIHGLTIKTSTVGGMIKEGGQNFYKLCKDSMWEERNDNGETITGLYNLFIPAYVCLDGFIDIYGNPIIDDPTEDDLWRIPYPTRDVNGKLIGAKTYLDKQNFSLHVENDQLTIEAVRETKEEETNERYTRCEFRVASIKRSFKLPKTVNQDAINAVYENGILNVTLGKKEEAKPVVKTIPIG